MSSLTRVIEADIMAKRSGICTAFCLLFCLVTTLSHGQHTGESSHTYTLQKKFLHSLNSGKDTGFPLTEKSGLVYGDSLVIGEEHITGLWKEIIRGRGTISYDTLASFQLYPGQLFVHGEYSTASGKKYSSVIGWVRSGEWVKAFEAVAPRGESLEDMKTEINLLRASWELYSNQHRPDLIAKNVFAPTGRYFYRGTIYTGSNIADAYSYMEDENYSIDLSPQKVIPVNPELTYEIGIFDTGGKGLYFLMWGKAGEDWKLLLDFNF